VFPISKEVRYFLEALLRYKETLQKTVEEAKGEIVKQLNEINGKIVVLIDDIDRLTAQEIRELFIIVKAIADFPNTVYILAFDKKVVIKALEKVQEEKGENYLEKIIQVPIKLPLADKNIIRKMLFEELSVVLSGTPNELFDSTYWEDVYWDGIDPFINTVRDVKRLVNAVRITYPSVKGEVNAVDFIAIETLRVFCPEVYNLIKNNPNMFCGYSRLSSHGSQDIEILRQFHQNQIQSLALPDKLKENIKSLLMRLFPKLQSVFGNMYYGPEKELDWRKKFRICSKEIFPRFFIFSVPLNDLSRAEIEVILSFLPDKEKFCKYLKRLIKQKRSDGSTKLSIFLERMEDYTSEILQENVPIIIETFLTIGDEFLIPEDKDKTFTLSPLGRDIKIPWGNDIRMERIILQLLRRYNDKNKKFEILKDAFVKGRAISMMVKMITTFWQLHKNYENLEESYENVLLDENHLEILRKIVLNKIKNIAKKEKLLETSHLLDVLYRWKEWGDENEVNDWVSNIVNSDEKLPIFLSKFLRKVDEIHWELNLNWLKDFIDLDILEKRCNEILSNNLIVAKLKDKEKLAINQFLKKKHLINSYT